MRRYLLLLAALLMLAGCTAAWAAPSGPPTCKPNGHFACPTPTPTDTATATPTGTSTATATPTDTSTATATPTGTACVTSDPQGECGPYDSYPGITGTTSSTYIGNNMWNPIAGASSTLTAYDPGNWSVTAAMPAGNTAVVSYPSIGANYGLVTDQPAPLSGFTSITSSFSEDMHANGGTSAWAAYDIWTNPGTSFANPGNEVMIQHDFAGNGPCTYVAVADFGGGANGVPAAHWGLCQLGTELIWKLAPASAAAGDSATVSEQSGSVDILAMLDWLMAHGYMAADSGLGLAGYGWEIASTGGQAEQFAVSGFTLDAS